MKTCKKCEYFSGSFCRAFNIPITSTLNACNCKRYKITQSAIKKENRTSNIKCNNCGEFRFNWCRNKRKLIEEPDKLRNCVKYRLNPNRNKQK